MIQEPPSKTDVQEEQAAMEAFCDLLEQEPQVRDNLMALLYQQSKDYVASLPEGERKARLLLTLRQLEEKK